MQSLIPRLVAILTILVTGGCVTPPQITVATAPEPARWEAHRSAIQAIQTWEAEGRVAADFAGDSASGSVNWSQSFDLVDFRFRGPFGIGGFRIYGDGDRLRVRTSRGDDFILEDPIEDMRVQLGWALPVRAMRYWIVGIPDPGRPADLAFLPSGALVALVQDGWEVDFADFEERAGFTVPRKVSMRGDGVELRFVIDRWAPEAGDRVESSGEGAGL
jgi:outer membrane lipoprotein LolB